MHENNKTAEGYTNLYYVKFGYEDYVNAMGSKFKPI